MEKIGVKVVTKKALMCNRLNLKQSLLLFDKILIDQGSLESSTGFSRIPLGIPQKMYLLPVVKSALEEIEFLEKVGLIGFTDESFFKIGSHPETPLSDELVSQIVSFSQQSRIVEQKIGSAGSTKELEQSVESANNLSIRHFCSLNNITKADTYVPIVSSMETIGTDKKCYVYSFLLNRIPAPDDSISWEQVNELKSDTDLKRKYYALIKWINDTVRSDKTINDIHDEYNYLSSQYETQIQLHQLKYNMTTLEIIVKMPFDIVGNFISSTLSHLTSKPISFGNILKPLFDIKKSKIELLESELKMEGREVAYIHTLNAKIANSKK